MTIRGKPKKFNKCLLKNYLSNQKLVRILKRLIKKLYSIFILNKGQRVSLSQAFGFLKSQKFYPETIIDIGVAKGTKPLYVNFPKSFYLLIEPIKEYEYFLKKILNKHRGDYCLAAASKEKGEVSFNIHPNHMDGSSLLKEEIGENADGYKIRVPTIRVDDLVKDKQLKGPFLIKVDVQGAELDALEGAKITMQNTEVIVLEVSLFKFMKGAPDFYEVIFFMKENGFVVYDILKGCYRPLDNALAQVDIIFVKEEGSFRRDHRFGTTNQLKKIGII